MPSLFDRKMKIKKKTNNTIKSQLIKVITSPCLQWRGDSHTRPAPMKKTIFTTIANLLLGSIMSIKGKVCQIRICLNVEILNRLGLHTG